MSDTRSPSVEGRGPRLDPARAFLIVLALAAVLRGLYLWDNLAHNPFSRLLVLDSAHYDLWGVAVSEGDWLGEHVFLQAPLYPYLLGLLYWLVGRRLWLVYVLQHGLGLLNVWLTWRLGRRWFDERVALVGTALFVLYPFAVFVEGKVLVTTLYVTLSLLTLELAGGLAENPRLRRGVLLGLVLGVASVTRSNGLVLLVLVVAWLVAVAPREGRRRSACVAAVVVAACAVVAPVTVRNWVVGRSFVPVSAGGGLAFARSNVLGGRGGFEPVPELPDSVVKSPDQISELAEIELGRKPSAREVSAFWMQRTLGKLREQPGAWLRLEAWKALRMIDNYEHGTENALSEERPTTPVLYLFLVPAGVILAFAAVGLAGGLGEVGRRSLLYLYVGSLVAGMLVFAVVGRYRLPVMPVLALFAGWAMVGVGEAARGKRWLKLAALALPAAGLLVVSFWQPDGVYGRQEVKVSLNLAELQAQDRQHQAVIETTTRILGIRKDVGRARFLRGNSLLALGHYWEGEEDLREAIRLSPKRVSAYLCLGAHVLQTGRPREALSLLKRGTELDPENAFGWSSLGGAYLELGRLEEAEAAHRHALALKATLLSARVGLAHTLFAAGRYEEALQEYRRVAAEELSQSLRAAVAGNVRTCEERLSRRPEQN